MKTLQDYMTPVSIILLAMVLLYNHLSPQTAPKHEPTVNGEALGKAYAPVLASSYADGWLAAAKAIEDGKSVTEAQKTLQETWHEARVTAFKNEVQPGFAVVLPEGTEPNDPAKRSQVAELWRSFASGLKKGR